ncbi:MAG: DNA mismatch endonuclease Vsr [Deltaproteobacteria bacterium]|jgi:DNA (cytosine-5)-methyltransferase 1|nr:DNA mismatch endonuclease Vsr [Deltaproteobacteria bacterium]
MAQRTKEQTGYIMSHIRAKDTSLEKALRAELDLLGLTTYTQNDAKVFGKPDFAFKARKVAVFCDSEFWHGKNFGVSELGIKNNPDFWQSKLRRNVERDAQVNETLKSQGWSVLRFWGDEITKNAPACALEVEKLLRRPTTPPFRFIDLRANIGGLRRAFELTGHYQHVLSSETDRYACLTYESLFGQNPQNDLTDDSFKRTLLETPYDILLAGFPSRAFRPPRPNPAQAPDPKAPIFFHLADIIGLTRPCAFLLEAPAEIVTLNKARTFSAILDTLSDKLKYTIIGLLHPQDQQLSFNAPSFILNSQNFGLPLNRHHAFIMGFDRERFSPGHLERLPSALPHESKHPFDKTLSQILEVNVDPKYYLSTAFLNRLSKRKKIPKQSPSTRPYRVLNDHGVDKPLAIFPQNSLGSPKERNLVYDPRLGIAGLSIKGKKSPLNDQGLRFMTPEEWAKLHGFADHAFLENAQDRFSFPKAVPDVQRYKQILGSVSIPVAQELAQFMATCLSLLAGPPRNDPKP